MAQNLTKTVLATVFLIVAGFIPATSKPTKNAMKTPDFAFPLEVVNHSRAQLDKALEEGEPVQALRALMNLSIASNSISNENAVELINRIDSVSRQLPAPYGAIGFLIEAEMYKNMYMADRWTYDNRTVAPETKELNPQFWDKTLFGAKIDSLTDSALDQRAEASVAPLSDISSLIQKVEDEKDFYIYDFIVYKVLDLRNGFHKGNIIPFYPSDSPEGEYNPVDLIDQLIELHPEPSFPLLCAVNYKFTLLEGQEGVDFLWNQIQHFRQNPEVMMLMSTFYTTYGNQIESAGNGQSNPEGITLPISLTEFFNMCQQMKKDFHKDKNVQCISSVIGSIAKHSVNLSFPSAVMISKEFDVKVRNKNLTRYFVLLLDVSQVEGRSYSAADLDAKTKVVDFMEITADNTVPFQCDTTIKMKAPAPGKYALAVSSTKSPKDIISENKDYIYLDYFNASDIDIFALNDTGTFTVNSADGSPVEGAKVTFETNNYNDRWNKVPKTETKTTDADGLASSSFRNSSATASYRGSTAQANISNSYSSSRSSSYRLRFFTDRKTYRPGDTVNYMGLMYYVDGNQATICAKDTTTVLIYDANHTRMEVKKFKTDESGRFTGSFTIPADGLLGSYTIQGAYGGTSFNVAEYKTPSMLLTLRKSSSEGDSITFKGKVATYSGMPLAGLKVELNIEYTPFYFFFSSNRTPQQYTTEVVSDANGDFEHTLPLGNLDPKEYRGVFSIRATATDAAGETASSPSELFWLKEAYTISPNIPSKICGDSETITFLASVKDAAGLPAVKTLVYVLKDSQGKEVTQGEFQSPNLELPSTLFPSGAYTISLEVKDELSQKQNCEFIVYRTYDEKPPVESILWVPVNDIIVKPSDKTVSLTYGSSHADQRVLCVIGDSNGNKEYRWLWPEGKNITLEVSAPSPNERKYVEFIASRNHKTEWACVTLTPAVQLEQFEIVTESFRNSVSAGEEEAWKFKLLFGGKEVPGYAYAVLYDKAMDAIAPLHWNSHLFSKWYSNPINLTYNSRGICSQYFGIPAHGRRYFYYPQFNFHTYGHPLYGGIGYYTRGIIYDECANFFAADDMEVPASAPQMKVVRAMKTSSIAEDSSIVEGAEEEVAFSNASDAGAAEKEEVEYRSIEMPVAFFKPDLTSTEEGTVDIDFTVPNFNTTWKLILGAYTPALEGAQITLEIVASKKVMVKMLPPRFLRTGDKATITATLFNNTTESQDIYGVLEIFNPLTGETIKQITSPTELIGPSANRVISIDYDCPADLSCLGLRVFAKGAGASDGEQTVIPVLPSSQPVIESDPFYLAPGQTEYSMRVPAEHEGASVTLKYSDNPTWEMVTALPAIINPDSESLMAQVYALYANSVGYGLMKKNPNLAKGLEMMLEGEAGDSILVSNLEKDQELKTVTLNNTPWVNNARNETLRMASLGSLLDSAKAESQISSLWVKIMNLQSPDGGWSWCPQMKPSLWPTEIVLINIGLLKAGNYLAPIKSIDVAVNEGVRYCDAVYLKDYAESRDKTSFYYWMKHYLFTRSFFPELTAPAEFIRLKKRALDYLQGEWKKMSIFDKTTLAITLWRDGRKDVARTILESLRQFASESPLKGAWFDNLDSSWGGANKMLTTARVLVAFNEIEPADPIIDKIRQWILLQRQAQDFQEGLFSVDVIDAMLTTGTEWTGDYPSPEITIGGVAIPQTEIARLTGECKVDIDIESTKDAEIKIDRFSPTPAWGGVISQYVAPMLEVKADAIEGLGIEKEFWKIIDGEDGKQAVKTSDFHIGDLVRVTLIVDCGRDMDFVALTDQRPACLEPVDQLSGYDLIDGMWCYHETRNSATNLFFGFMPRGRHIISYECRVMEAGEFTAGIATLQSQYAPVLTAHSAGQLLNVKPLN